MMLTFFSYTMIITFMFLVMKRKMSPFASLVFVPLIFSVFLMITGNSNNGSIGEFVLNGIKTVSNTGIMLLFAILYFSIMLEIGRAHV